jgi:hypothetical protein
MLALETPARNRLTVNDIWAVEDPRIRANAWN